MTTQSCGWNLQRLQHSRNNNELQSQAAVVHGTEASAVQLAYRAAIGRRRGGHVPWDSFRGKVH